MKANRKTMLGVALAVAVIALAGIGYAAGGYTAKTENTNNALDTVYNTIHLKVNGVANYTGFMKEDIELDTITDNTDAVSYDFHNKTARYVLNGSVYDVGTIDGENPANAVAVSDVLTVAIDATNGSAGELKMTINKSFLVDDLVFIVVINNATTGAKLMSSYASETTIANFTNSTTNVEIQVFAISDGSFDWNKTGNITDGVKFSFNAVAASS